MASRLFEDSQKFDKVEPRRRRPSTMRSAELQGMVAWTVQAL